MLAELRHPGIVRYIAHGTTLCGEPYLAMEWLEGEDLADRLARAGLTIDESVRLVTRIADALAFAHARGIVHRDVKPSNIFLPGRDVDRATLLDFGIARRQFATPWRSPRSFARSVPPAARACACEAGRPRR